MITKTNTINNLYLVVGNNDAKVLPQVELKFELSLDSVYLNSPWGALFIGIIQRYVNNIAH